MMMTSYYDILKYSCDVTTPTIVLLVENLKKTNLIVEPKQLLEKHEG